MSGVDVFADEMLWGSSICEPLTKDELDMAENFTSLPDPDDTNENISFSVRLLENREGQARTKDEKRIVDDRPVVLESSNKTFSMHRLLWVNGTRVIYKTDKEGKRTATPQKATLAVFKLYFESRTKSSGTGTDKAIECARIQVDFHGVESENKRPRVLGWAPFMVRSNEMIAQHTDEKSLNASVNGGIPQIGGTIGATASSSRSWEQPFYEKYYSRPVYVSGARRKKTANTTDTTDTQKDYNGVSWIMEQNRKTREGIEPALQVCLLFAREDDSKYAVRISARVGTRSLRNFGHNPEHKCVLLVNPGDNKPPVCSPEGRKMLDQLDVDHLEKLLPSRVDASLDIPWEEKESAKGTKNGTLGTSTAATAGAKPSLGNAKNDNNAADGHENSNPEGFEVSKNDENKNRAYQPLSATLTAELRSPIQAEKRSATVSLDDLGLESCVTDALRAFSEKGDRKSGNEECNLAAQVATLESRMEVMEYRIARQALVIRALLKRGGQ